MKYYFYAKILGPLLPEKSLKINGCKIYKGHNSDHHPHDRSVYPVIDATNYYHLLGSNVKNFIQYSQRPLSTRTFESEYFISTEVNSTDLRRALGEAESKFETVVALLSFSLKTTIRKAGNRRIKRDDEYYDFEIVASYAKRGNHHIRTKLPEPLVNGHNFFPTTPPRGFLGKSKKILSCHDGVFWKALFYIHNASRIKNSGNWDQLFVILNFVKSIELISKVVIPQEVDAVGKKIYMKNRMKFAGKALRVTKKNIRYAQYAWDVRNDSDIAHARQYRGGKLPDFFGLQSAASDFLVKYYRFVINNPPQSYVLGGRHGWRVGS